MMLGLLALVDGFRWLKVLEAASRDLKRTCPTASNPAT